ncbi:MAG: VWA domain-containing protein, partial [Acinetobacter sp.]
TDRNGKPVGPATDGILAQGDNDTDPSTPEDTGLDLVKGEITVDIVESGKITGTTQDVAPNTDVVLTITGKDVDGNDVTISKTVQTDANGNYDYQLTVADVDPVSGKPLVDGSAVNVEANTTDRNGKPVGPATDGILAQADPLIEISDNGDNAITGDSGEDILVGDYGGIKTNFVPAQDYNVSIVLDLSGSMDYELNYEDGKSRLDIVKSGLKHFVQKMVDHDGLINLQFSTFSGDLGDERIFNIVNSSNIESVFKYIDELVADSNTQPHLGFNKANEWFKNISNGYENQTYYLTDGNPSTSLEVIDLAFAPLAEKSKVFAVGISEDVYLSNVERYDNTDISGNKIVGNWDGDLNHGTAQQFTEADKLIAYLIGGSENFVPADVGNDIVKGGAGDDILFGDAMNTDWITGLDSLQYPKYSGYSKLIAHLKATETGGAEPTQQEVYDFVKANYMKLIEADAADPNIKGGNDIIYGGSANDIIIAGAGNDRIYGGSGDDIISTGRGDDTIVYDVLNAADATGGNGTDTWVDYAANDKIEFRADFFEGLLADKSNISEYIKVEDVNGKAVLKLDRDGDAGNNGGTTHDWADLLIIEGKTALELQDLINNQIIIG